MTEENADIEGAMEEEEDSDDPNLNLELHAFRAQWMSELKPSSEGSGLSGRLLRGSSLKKTQDAAREEKAAELFLRAVQEEQDGAVYEAIKFYRMAMQLVPDIEFRINYSRPDTDGVERKFGEESDCDGDIEDLVTYFEQQLTLESAFPKICSPEVEGTQRHISELPQEILMYMFRWVVSSDLDMRALEQLSLVCRGFYICAREPELWRSACLKVWGRNGTKLAPYLSWREMFLQRPRVRFDGVYISKASYIRQGEKSLDGFYRPWHHVEFYRYIRFFSDGSVMMLTTPDVPLAVVPRLRRRNTRMESVLFGHYRLSQERDNQTKVYAVLCKRKEEKPVEKQMNRFCRRNPAPEAEQNFCVGLHLSSRGRQRFCKLEWFQHSYQVIYKRTGEVIDTTFDLDKMYTPFFFARVKSYTDFSVQPL